METERGEDKSLQVNNHQRGYLEEEDDKLYSRGGLRDVWSN